MGQHNCGRGPNRRPRGRGRRVGALLATLGLLLSVLSLGAGLPAAAAAAASPGPTCSITVSPAPPGADPGTCSVGAAFQSSLGTTYPFTVTNTPITNATWTSGNAEYSIGAFGSAYVDMSAPVLIDPTDCIKKYGFVAVNNGNGIQTTDPGPYDCVLDIAPGATVAPTVIKWTDDSTGFGFCTWFPPDTDKICDNGGPEFDITINWKPTSAPPTASFTATQSAPATSPGQYQLVSTSTDPGGEALDLTWSFDDGTTAQGPAVTHTFLTPGSHAVTLTATDTSGLTSSTTQTVTVAAPKLQVALDFVDSHGTVLSSVSPQLGDTFDARLTVSASDGVGSLSGVTVAGDTLSVTPQSVASVAAPSPALPATFTLAPDTSTVVTFPVTTTGYGTAALAVSATAKDAAGNTVGPATGQAGFAVQSLRVTLATGRPGTPDKPVVGQPEPVTATITNKASGTVTGLRPTLSTPAAGSTISAPSPSSIASLGPNASATVTWNFTAAAPHPYTLNANVNYVDPDGKAQTAYASAAITPPCSNGKSIEIDSVDGTGDDGAEVGQPVTVTGCGFDPSTTLTFGNHAAVAQLTDDEISDFGTKATLPLPWDALTGNVIADNTTDILPSPKPLMVDSFRNTDGFAFPNTGVPNSATYLVDAFPGQKLVDAKGNLLPSVQAFYTTVTTGKKGQPVGTEAGICWGLALYSGQFSSGAENPETYGAGTAFELRGGTQLGNAVTSGWWTQFSDQATGYKVTRYGTADEVDQALTKLFAGNGFAHPVIIGMINPVTGLGHAIVAFGVSRAEDGTVTIHAANSNIPYTGSEDEDARTHEGALTNSNIVINKAGGATVAGEGWVLPVSNLWLTPVSALESGLTLTQATQVFQSTVGAGTSLGAVDDPQTGAPLDLQNLPNGEAFVPVTDAVNSGAAAATFYGSDAAYPTTVSSSTGISQFWSDGTTSAWLQSGPGSAHTLFDPATDTLTTSAVAAPHIQLTRTVDGVERVASVTSAGDSGATVTLNGAGQLVLSSPGGGSFTVSVGRAAAGQPSLTSSTRTVTLQAGQTVDLTPDSWSDPTALVVTNPAAGATTSGTGSLAATGNPTELETEIALAFLLTGGLTTTLARRRRRPREESV